MQVAVRTIDELMVRRIHENLVRRAEACIEVHGVYFENLL